MVDKKKQKIEFKIVEIKKISHFENDFSKYDLVEDDIKTGKMEIGLKINIEGSKGAVTFIVNVNCFHPSPDNKFLLFGIETLHKYRIKNFNKLFKVKGQENYNLPGNLMNTFLGLAISGTRGMLAVLNTTPVYKTLFVPLIDPQVLISNLKKDKQ